MGTRETPEQATAAVSPALAASVFRRVLCGVDGKAGGFDAAHQAASLTGADGELTLLVVTSYRNEGELRSPAIGPLRAKEIAERALAAVRATGARAEVEVEPSAPPAQAVLDWSADYDLLAIGAPSTSWFGGM